VPKLSEMQIACLMRVLGKPELSNAIRLNELEILMSNFTQAPEKKAFEAKRPSTKQSREDKSEKKSKKKRQIAEMFEQNPEVFDDLKEFLNRMTI
jgi:hypothetical protein